ncbi:MAG: peptidoglycan DD-metalloendopeptidase family protein [Gammaproteobacteria bacterium]|uniref:peptidoglycan DD-metalloendopeptidase family protein n=1 Tax=Limnobacter sp. TaxID=2003368 RepID=UPI001DB78314|nr:peptidoglycan DD-metalloendopeptidase family protein [Limnobacter sp.]MBU0783066.1 peptidoglycan DD-metalloendopeptidase family protein [Gammaproteobacteria bacterium]MBU0849653.1 peptidoglycan DD-metalloendopeptidase family protein [Gammaproteobacteria bacterium]MBU1266104.1 peptidoglycan DD-metalloendopeptidase family protein [Gammaproteobacteria bacterium]MBU1529295.1 peptidoglycan DD-metalloendopeptidase family protein [Gammaproteobacteria bacterium]MBU1779326.1 peptidoglycan DD-metallo
MKRGVFENLPLLGHTRALAVGFATLIFLGACTTTGNQAPVVDRLPSRSSDSAVVTDGIYTVKAGDTLYSIALDFGLDWRELARANNLSDPGKLSIGQKLRVTGAPGAVAGGSASGTITEDSGVEITPIPPAGGAKPIENAPAPEIKPPAPTAVTLGFIWPHPGEIVQGYKPGVNKGIDLTAKVGDPVLASQAGRVVYSGNALRGYGNLIILKHDNNLLTAYAHNKTLLVKEGEPVTKGQRIAEAGQSDTDRPKLHFEVRKQGKPVDPMDYLPAR